MTQRLEAGVLWRLDESLDRARGLSSGATSPCDLCCRRPCPCRPAGTDVAYLFIITGINYMLSELCTHPDFRGMAVATVWVFACTTVSQLDFGWFAGFFRAVVFRFPGRLFTALLPQRGVCFLVSLALHRRALFLFYFYIFLPSLPRFLRPLFLLSSRSRDPNDDHSRTRHRVRPRLTRAGLFAALSAPSALSRVAATRRNTASPPQQQRHNTAR